MVQKGTHTFETVCYFPMDVMSWCDSDVGKFLIECVGITSVSYYKLFYTSKPLFELLKPPSLKFRSVTILTYLAGNRKCIAFVVDHRQPDFWLPFRFAKRLG